MRNLPKRVAIIKNGLTQKEMKESNKHWPLPGKGPWFRMDGVWYTKDETGQIVPMKS